MTDGVPYDAEIEYLESTGTQWIDTGFTPNADTAWFTRCEFTAYAISKCGTAWRTGGMAFVQRAESQTMMYTRGGYHNYDTTVNPGLNPFTIELDGSHAGVKVNGEWRRGQDSRGWDNTGNTEQIRLFAGYETLGATPRVAAGKMKIFKSTISVSGTLVRDYIPVRVGQTGYLYDRVTRRLFGNSGTGSFVLGPDVARPVLPARAVSVKPYDAEIEYLDRGREDGTTGEGPYIDTGMVFPTNYYYSIDCYLYAPYAVGQSAYHGAGGLAIMHPNKQPYCLGLLGNDQIVAPARYTLDRVKIHRDTTGRSFVFFNMRFGGNGGFNRGSRSRLYRFTAWNAQNTLVVDFIPVRIGTTGFLYDRANPTGGPLGNGLYPNAGTGSFVLGPDVRVERPLAGLVPVARNVRVLPYDAEVDYVQTTNNAASTINTGIKPNGSDTSFTVKFKIANEQKEGNQLRSFCDQTINGIRSYFGLAFTTGTVTIFAGVKTKGYSSSSGLVGVFALNNGPMTASYDCETRTLKFVNPTNPSRSAQKIVADNDWQPFTASWPIFYGIDAALGPSVQLYVFQIWKYGVLVRDYIPVRVGSVGYLYDRVTRSLYGSATSTPLIAGPDK